MVSIKAVARVTMLLPPGTKLLFFLNLTDYLNSVCKLPGIFNLELFTVCKSQYMYRQYYYSAFQREVWAAGGIVHLCKNFEFYFKNYVNISIRYT